MNCRAPTCFPPGSATGQVDPAFEGLDGGAGSLIKYNPLSNVTSAEVWNFIRVMNVPFNELHSKVRSKTSGLLGQACEL